MEVENANHPDRHGRLARCRRAALARVSIPQTAVFVRPARRSSGRHHFVGRFAALRGNGLAHLRVAVSLARDGGDARPDRAGSATAQRHRPMAAELEGLGVVNNPLPGRSRCWRAARGVGTVRNLGG